MPQPTHHEESKKYKSLAAKLHATKRKKHPSQNAKNKAILKRK